MMGINTRLISTAVLSLLLLLLVASPAVILDVAAFTSSSHRGSHGSSSLSLLSRRSSASAVSSSPLLSQQNRNNADPSSFYHHRRRTGYYISTTPVITTSLKSTTAATAAGAEEGAKPSGGDATITALIFNLVKGIVGAGVLTLPAGIAAFGDAPSAALPAVLLIAGIGTMSGYGFALIGRVCALTRTTSFRDAWTASVGEETSWIPAWSVTLKTCFATLAYSMILADTFWSIFQTVGLQMGKTATLASITSLVLLPLCLLKNLSQLAPFSLLGTIGMVYTAVAMAIRYSQGAYAAPLGAFCTDLPSKLRPAFGAKGAASIFSPATAILVGMLSTAYMAHFNAPKFYTELKDNTVPRFMKVVSTSFGIAIGIFAVMAGLGFLTFGKNCSGLILNNYSPRDAIMSISKTAVAFSIVFSYPLTFVGAREGILDLLKVKDRSDKRNNMLTVGLLTGLSVLARIIPDVSFVMAFVGATLGNALIYVFPALMFRGAIKKLDAPTKLQKAEVKVAMTSAVLGIVMGALGAFKAVQNSFF